MKIFGYATLRGLNFAGIKFCGSLHPRNFDIFADGFRNIFANFAYGTCPNFFVNFAVLETAG